MMIQLQQQQQKKKKYHYLILAQKHDNPYAEVCTWVSNVKIMGPIKATSRMDQIYTQNSP